MYVILAHILYSMALLNEQYIPYSLTRYTIWL